MLNHDRKIDAFFENAGLLQEEMQIIPLLYGSLGLEYLTKENFVADDIDILIPQIHLAEQWSVFRAVLERNGYHLIDAHEHTFEKNGIHFSYARLEELEAFAGIFVPDIAFWEANHIQFRLLTLEQYLKVYTASSKDGYRMNVKERPGENRFNSFSFGRWQITKISADAHATADTYYSNSCPNRMPILMPSTKPAFS